MAKTIYVYKEYNEDAAYGEELIKCYDDKNAAMRYLKRRVNKAFGVKNFKKLPHCVDDTLNDDYVSVYKSGCVHYWIIEAVKLHESKKEKG